MKIHLIERSTTIVNDEEIDFGDLSITQGLSYYLSLFIRGDYSNWIPKGQIRTGYYDAGGIVETDFLFKPNLFVPRENITFIMPYLLANVTTELISTVYQAKPNQTPNEDNCFLYNLVLKNPLNENDIIPLVDTSFVQIKPGVTINE